MNEEVKETAVETAAQVAKVEPLTVEPQPPTTAPKSTAASPAR